MAFWSGIKQQSTGSLIAMSSGLTYGNFRYSLQSGEMDERRRRLWKTGELLEGEDSEMTEWSSSRGEWIDTRKRRSRHL